MELYVIKDLTNKVLKEDFSSKAEARKVRNGFLVSGTVCVISKGKDHWRGSTTVFAGCLNKDRAEKRKRQSRRSLRGGDASFNV